MFLCFKKLNYNKLHIFNLKSVIFLLKVSTLRILFIFFLVHSCHPIVQSYKSMCAMFRQKVLNLPGFLLWANAVILHFDVTLYRPFVMTKLSCGLCILLHCSLKCFKHLKGVHLCLTEISERRRWLKEADTCLLKGSQLIVYLEVKTWCWENCLQTIMVGLCQQDFAKSHLKDCRAKRKTECDLIKWSLNYLAAISSRVNGWHGEMSIFSLITSLQRWWCYFARKILQAATVQLWTKETMTLGGELSKWTLP